VVVGLDDFSAFSASLFAAKEGDPDCSCAAEETEEGEKDKGGDDTDYNTSDGAGGKAMRIAGFCASESDVCTSGDRGEEGNSGGGR
jgi:hypothetical protein